jgi:hypothetical protein
MSIWIPVLATTASAVVGGPLMWLLHRFDRRNTQQHGENISVLRNIETKIEHLDGRMDSHFEWHMKKD